MLSTYQLSDYGLGCWLLEAAPESIAQHGASLAAMLESHALIDEVVLGYASLLIRSRTATEPAALRALIDTLPADASAPLSSRHHDIDVDYCGPDLEEVAKATGLSESHVIQLHSAPLYRVRFLGFSPGFAYLDGLDPQLHLPRHSSPRPRMEAGAVAIGGAHASIYTIPSPGGWHWLGNTQHPLFQPERDDASAFCLQPGDTLSFHPQPAP